MPRFINQEQIPMELRRPHLERYRRQLRDGLLNPGMTALDRARLKEKLAQVGVPKVYGPVSVPGAEPAPGAVSTTEVESEPAPREQTRDNLLALSKDELLDLAQTEGAEALKSWNKSKIADAILTHRSAESS